MQEVFLGGTWNGSTWRDKLIPMLQIHYFNPIVKSWTEECQAKEIEKKDSCDFCLYAITPRMSGVYSIAEVVDDSNKRPEKTIMVILESDDYLAFDEGRMRSLNAVASMVIKNGGSVFYDLESAANFMNKEKR